MRSSLGILVVSIVVYLTIGLYDLSLPGLHYDEAADAVPAMQMIQGAHPSSISTINLFGREWPLMMLHHIGPTTIYTSWVGFLILGVSVGALRISQMAVGTIALVLLWCLARIWYGSLVAALAAALCATSPAFIWWSRAGANWTIPLLPLSLALMICLTAWWRSQRWQWLVVTAIVFGAGVMTKILFIWLAAPVVLTALLVKTPKVWLRSLAQLGISRVCAVLIGLCFGAFPLIVYNIPSLATLRFVMSNAQLTTTYGHNNLDFLTNIRTVLIEWFHMVGGDTLSFEGPPGLWQLGAMVWLMILLAGVIEQQKKTKSGRSPSAVFLVALPVAVLPISTVSTSSIGATYVFFLVPFAMLMIAKYCARGLQKRPGGIKIFRTLVGFLIALVLINQLATNIMLLQFFEQSGGNHLWSDSIVSLSSYLAERPAAGRLIVLDWGFKRNLELLTGDKVNPEEMFGFSQIPEANFEVICSDALRQPNVRFIAHALSNEVFRGRLQICERNAQKLGLQFQKDAVFVQRDGAVNSELYSVVSPEPLRAIPADYTARNATIGDGVTLLGHHMSVNHALGEITLRLLFRADQDKLVDDTLLIHVINESTGQLVLAADQKPRYGYHSFDQWLRGELVDDIHWLAMPPDLPSGTYQIRVGRYDAATGVRRAIVDPLQDSAGDSLRIETFQW